jgi:hypothetical protein
MPSSVCTVAHVQEVSAHADAHPDGEGHPHAPHAHAHAHAHAHSGAVAVAGTGVGAGVGTGTGVASDATLPRIKGALSPPRKTTGPGQGQGANAARNAAAAGRGGTQPNKVNSISFVLLPYCLFSAA